MAPPNPPRFAYKGDRLKPLRAFCQVARLGSVSRAAEALYVSQPAVSQQLQALERELGAALFERNGRRLLPTPEGEALYELARPLVEGIDALPAAFRRQLAGMEAGELDRVMRFHERGSAAAKAEGHGLGLGIASALAASGGYRLSCRSSPGKGTAFFVDFELAGESGLRVIGAGGPGETGR